MSQVEPLQVEGTFPGADGLELYYRSWHPPVPPQAVLGIVHGLGSHSGWFDSIGEALLPRGYGVYGFDLRGHGRSPGQRGHIRHWAEFRADFDHFWQLMHRQHPHLPCFVLGHSLGAIIVLDDALRTPQRLSGIIAMAPALTPVGVPPLRLAIGRLLSQVYPRFTLNSGISKSAGSHDPAIVAAYLNDPLRHTKGTARLATEFLQTVRWIQTHLQRLQTPILILHGSDDGVALPASSRWLFEQISFMDKEYREYPGGYHDLHNDLEAPLVAADIANWLDRHVRGERPICKLSDRRLLISHH
ncbi:MAG: lysophospholipase [Scytolyngbya sp. HA4215-MV1]|jgi:alpha-beta hydrolase superfamily lysophospholipase|nr:lysophospholipase [Scytolyngbya sp. HA4215-MV1]